jgi:hypothetical protein
MAFFTGAFMRMFSTEGREEIFGHECSVIQRMSEAWRKLDKEKI